MAISMETVTVLTSLEPSGATFPSTGTTPATMATAMTSSQKGSLAESGLTKHALLRPLTTALGLGPGTATV